MRDTDGRSRLQDINNSCLEVFRSHWECLDNNNQQLWQCRKKERALNACVFDNLVSFLFVAVFVCLQRQQEDADLTT